MKNFTPVIFGGYVNGYSLARTFFETYEVKSIVFDVKKSATWKSAFCENIIVANPQSDIEAFICSVEKIGEQELAKGNKPLIVVTNDMWLVPLATNKKRLSEIFLYSFSDIDVINKMYDKGNLYAMCDDLGVIYPKTALCNKLDTNIDDLKAPFLVKPVSVVEYISLFPKIKRNNIFETKQETLDFLNKLYSAGFNGSLIIQEFIPGGIENLCTVTTYSDTYGKVKGVSIGCKLLQYPENAGTITAGLIKEFDRVLDLTNLILESEKYFGIANTEFKYDARDDSYKLIEVNLRPGMWNYSSVLSGVNLIEMLVEDAVNGKNIDFKQGKKQFVWSVTSLGKIKTAVKNTQNEDIVNKLIQEKKVVNPLFNKNECVLYKIIKLKYRARIMLFDVYKKIKNIRG